MIVVKVELWPKGDESRAREIGRGTIANVGGSDSVGEYEVALLKSPEYAKSPGVWRRGRVRSFRRKTFGPWELLALALIATLGDRIARSAA